MAVFLAFLPDIDIISELEFTFSHVLISFFLSFKVKCDNAHNGMVNLPTQLFFSTSRRICCRGSSCQNLLSAWVAFCKLSYWVESRDKKWITNFTYGQWCTLPLLFQLKFGKPVDKIVVALFNQPHFTMQLLF